MKDKLIDKFNVKIEFDDTVIARQKVNGIKGLKNIMRDIEDKFK